jgi:Concanavalin A-like lectin/glucanases superfamily
MGRRSFKRARDGLGALVLLAGVFPAGASAAALSLGAVSLGTPVTAPEPAGGASATTTYEWQRCAYWLTDAEHNGTFLAYPLGETGTIAHDPLNTRDGGTYVGPHPVASDGPFTGQGGPGTSFDGHSSAVSIGESNDQNTAFPFSVEVWARPRVIDDTYRYLFSRERTVGSEREGTGLWLSSHGLGLERWVSGKGSFIDYAPGLPVGQWSQVMATFDGTTLRLFVNGVQVGSRVDPGPANNPSPGPTFIGAGAAGRSGFFAGDLADAVLFIDNVARAHVTTEYADATKAPCTTIAGASGASYTPVLDDLGRTLVVNVTTPGDAPVTAQSREQVTHGANDPAIVTGLINDLSEGETVTGEVPVTATLYGLAAETVSFEVDSSVRYTKVAEAPYQYLWNTATVPNGPHVVSVLVNGFGGSTRTQVTVNVEN